MLTWQRQIAADPHRIFRATQRQDETRQQYVNARIAEYQRAFSPIRWLTFAELLTAFRKYGELYDQGYRLSDGQEGAA